jgi:hypothetical protein
LLLLLLLVLLFELLLVVFLVVVCVVVLFVVLFVWFSEVFVELFTAVLLFESVELLLLPSKNVADTTDMHKMTAMAMISILLSLIQ